MTGPSKPLPPEGELFQQYMLPSWRKILPILALPADPHNPAYVQAVDMAVSLLIWGLHEAKDVEPTAQQAAQIDPKAIADGRLLLLLSDLKWRRGEIEACIALIGRIDLRGLAVHPEFVARRQEMLDQCVAASMVCRDRGESKIALAILHKIRGVAKDHINAVVELLVFNLYTIENMEAVTKLLPELSQSQLNEPRIAVLVGEYHLRSGNFSEFLKSYARYASHDFAPVDFFNDIKHRQNLNVCVRAADVPHKVLEDMLGRPIDGLEPDALIRAGMQAYFKSAAEPDVLLARFNESYFINPLAIPKNRPATLDALDHLKTDDIELLAVMAHVLTAIHDDARIDRLFGSLLARRDAWTNPMLCRAAMIYIPRCKDRALKAELEKIIAGRPWKPDGWRYRSAALESMELSARSYALDPRSDAEKGPAPLRMQPPSSPVLAKTGGSRTIFIGLFGQLRYEGLNLPKLRAYLASVTEPFCRTHNINLRWAVATWNTAGERELLPTDGIGFILNRLPLPLVDFCAWNGVNVTASFAHAFPSVMKRLLNAPPSGSLLRRDDIEAKFGKLDAAAVTDIAPVDQVIETAYPSAQRNWLNQCRMWNRIAALGDLFAQWEKDTGETVVAALLTRIDLEMVNGDWNTMLEEILTKDPDRKVFADEDQLASSIEGIGDRFFVASRKNLSRVTDLWNALLAMAPEKDGSLAEFKKRHGSHAIIMSYLFQHGADIEQVDHEKLAFDLYRGRLTFAQLKRELAADATLAAGTESFQAALRELLRKNGGE